MKALDLAERAGAGLESANVSGGCRTRELSRDDVPIGVWLAHSPSGVLLHAVQLQVGLGLVL